ncbi:hypothetical protein DPSP01_011360 [Paraphaeosphaeria sporulosa]|uniref:Transcription initiation factor IIF subunit beta n=1 Tax=Paraphaeosphaeria sporulosa TaxID=1460663 RepID=A0A177CPL4_9PLEO|nr:uncharacterized protein CC84DRAFT_1162586 [Paraphaeosphaeria sporulosa]OAG08707.1 hypothetical protein CC84DRAFT_1162586 [Paraphaeosphaeria sporulosa]
MMKTEGGSPSFGEGGYMDDEFYEDTGELSLPREGEKHVMIARIPDWLYDHLTTWDKFLAQPGDDNEKITLGEVLSLPPDNAYDRNKAQKDGKKPSVKREGPPEPPSMRIFFNSDWNKVTKLPTAYEIEGQTVNETLLKNTYVFTEKDLPGYKHNGAGQNKANPSNGAVQDPKARVKKSKYKKAIPKQTALIGSVNTQYLAKPLNTAEFIAFNTARTKEAIQGRNSSTNIMTEIVDEVTVMNNLQNHFDGFVRPDKKRKSQQNKFARLPRNELIDILHAAFDNHKYWPMRAIKQHTKQPEAYLKEVLPSLAVLIKSGPFASYWKRDDSYDRPSLHDGIADIKIEEEEDDEEDEEMEDVV